MTYATQNDMVERFGNDEILQLTDKNNSGVIDVTVLGLALADADATIDGYLAARYSLPLASIPAAIPMRAADLARYYLYGLQVPEQVKARHDDAILWLTQVSKGYIELGIDAPTQAAEVGQVLVTSSTRTFSQDALSDFGPY